MTNLITRLREAKEGSRELDCDVFCATAESPFVSYHPDCVMATLGGFAARVEIKDIPAYTTDLSAAVALAEQMFPGCEHGYYYYKHRPGDEYAKATVAKIGGPHAEDIKARTPALALCLAIISVKAEPNQ